MTKLRIQAAPDDLESLRSFLYKDMGEKLELQEVSSVAPGVQREPVLIGLIVALGGQVIVEELARTIRRWMKYKETMKKLDIEFKLDLLRDGKVKHVSLVELETGPLE